ncbi:MAG: cob(I)yrinic acid a,c-diamide adenosyltransferase [Rikenellaceae bacterium]
MAIYTKTGDKGTTSLVGGERVLKTDVRLEAYGTVDELSAHVAYLRDSMMAATELTDEMTEEKDELLESLSLLMNVSAGLAAEESAKAMIPLVDESDITSIELAMDRISAELKPINRFTVPGGHPLISLSHIARTVCRRAERAALRVAESGVAVDAISLKYLNRLSDYLYLIGRLLALRLEVEELYWQGKKK